MNKIQNNFFCTFKMINKRQSYPILFCLLQINFGIQTVGTCNDVICGSVVSKCMLTQSCKCDLLNCTCCKECKDCLSILYTECCSCVDLCPKAEKTMEENIGHSQVKEFEGIPDLYNALTAEPEPDKWTTFVLPINLENTPFDYKPEIYRFVNNELFDMEGDRERISLKIVNCTVIFHKQCMTSNKCEEFCGTMGARGSRWFYDGCCECFGSNCLKFGINESKCGSCPNNKKDIIDSDWSMDEYDDLDLKDSNI